jgi:hypothetical protein
MLVVGQAVRAADLGEVVGEDAVSAPDRGMGAENMAASRVLRVLADRATEPITALNLNAVTGCQCWQGSQGCGLVE